MGLGKGNYSVALSLSRLDSHLDRNFEWRDYGLVFHVINNRQEDFVGCSWLEAQTKSLAPRNTSKPRHGALAMTRLLVECTHVFEHPSVNSGIQRVVRNVIKQLPPATKPLNACRW
jgi:hypothetical protein